MAHKHIGPEDWSVISRLLKAGYPGAEIARTIGKDSSAVNRHINKYGGRYGYNAREVRRQKKRQRIIAMESTRKLTGVRLREVKRLLKQYLRSKKGKYRRKRSTKIRAKTREQAKKRHNFKAPHCLFWK